MNSNHRKPHRDKIETRKQEDENHLKVNEKQRTTNENSTIKEAQTNIAGNREKGAKQKKQNEGKKATIEDQRMQTTSKSSSVKKDQLERGSSGNQSKYIEIEAEKTKVKSRRIRKLRLSAR
jgi:hypothetical protein